MAERGDHAGSRETIFALATGGGGAIAVMRLSGPASGAIVDALAGARPAPRRAVVRTLRGAAGEPLDRALILWMAGPASYTGEDSVEFHLHAGHAVIACVADRLAALGARPAEPGEFTRRAFLNGRMDLLEAEAVADLAAAETAAQRLQALRQLEGGLGDLYRGWAERLRLVVAEQEALIDFPDEDLPAGTGEALDAELARLGAEIATHLDDGGRGERLRTGLVFAVIGPPNVGKSSLVNALAEREVAIVAASPGTTRDALETRVVLGGVPVTLIDTAGIRETDDPVEAEGVRRARARARAADLVIAVTECGSTPPDAPPGALLVQNKLDLGRCRAPAALGVSALSGAGLSALRARLARAAQRLTASAGPPPLTRARHRAALRAASTHLAAARVAALPELAAEELRLALVAIGRITGEVGVEDLLDTIFSRFCIGK